jgi:hypothetical protein
MDLRIDINSSESGTARVARMDGGGSDRSTEGIVHESLHRYLAVEEFRAIRGRMFSHAERYGGLTEDDVLGSIS